MYLNLKEVNRLILIVLFIYAATSKLMNINNFSKILNKLPILNSLANVLSIGIPLVEIVIAIMLIIPTSINYGLKASMLLLTLFTTYLIYVLLGGLDLPCSCGEIISSMSWNQHLLFNLSIIGSIGWSLLQKDLKKL